MKTFLPNFGPNVFHGNKIILDLILLESKIYWDLYSILHLQFLLDRKSLREFRFFYKLFFNRNSFWNTNHIRTKQDQQRSSIKLRPPYKKKNSVCWETSIGFSCCFLFHQRFLMKLVADVFCGHIYLRVHCCSMYRGSCIVYMALFEWKYVPSWYFLTKVWFLFSKESTSVPNLHIEGTDIYAKFKVWPKI